MPDEIPTSENESPAESPVVEAGSETPDFAAIAATLPPSGNGQAQSVSEPAAKPGIVERAKAAVTSAVGKIRSHGKTGYRRGAPCRNGQCGKCKKCVEGGSFGAPAPGSEKPIVTPAPTVAQSPGDSGAQSVASDSPVTVADFQYYGKAGARVVSGVVDMGCDKLRAEMAALCREFNLDFASVERRVASLRLDDSTKSDLELFYAAVAMETGLPKGGGIIALGISIHFNIFSHFRAEANAMRSEFKRLAAANGRLPDQAPQPKATAAVATPEKMFPD